MLSSKNQSNCDSLAFSEHRVAFHLNVELLQFRSSNFTKISLFHSRPIFFQMLRPMRKKPFLCHAKFITHSFELKFNIFFVVVMKPIKRRGPTMNFAPIILVRPVCLHLHFSTFSRLSAALASNIFQFYLTISIFPCKNHYSHEILALSCF